MQAKKKSRGRPKGEGTDVTSIRLPIAALEGIDEMRAVEGRSRANMLRVMIERHLQCPVCREKSRKIQEEICQ